VDDDTRVPYIYRCDTAVASQLAVYEFTLKTKRRDPTPTITPVLIKGDLSDKPNWRTGTVYADAQNWARTVRFILPLLIWTLYSQLISVAYGITGEHAYANCASF